MDTLQKQFMRMVGYSAVGVVSGGMIGIIFGLIINGFYYLSKTGRYFEGPGGFYRGPEITSVLFSSEYAMIGGIIGGILAAIYIIRTAKVDERPSIAWKDFIKLVGYSALGMIFGSFLATSYALILTFIYGVILDSSMMSSFWYEPEVPTFGGLVGGILAGILVIRISKNEKR